MEAIRIIMLIVVGLAGVLIIVAIVQGILGSGGDQVPKPLLRLQSKVSHAGKSL